MNSRRMMAFAMLGVLGFATWVCGQDVAGVAGKAPKNIWTFLLPTPEQRVALKVRWCTSGLGQLVSNGMKPVSMMSGGLVKGICARGANPADLAKPPDSAEGAAARGKQDAIEAKARAAAVRYLGTLDCNWWPEAEDALIGALRGDRNECVRLEAAFALQRGCCCTKKVIAALAISASGQKEIVLGKDVVKDGFPRENSERVMANAAAALSMCVIEEPAEPEKLPEPKKEGPGTGETSADPATYYERIAKMPRAKVVADARLVLEKIQASSATAVAQRPTRANGTVGILTSAVKRPKTESSPSASREPPVQQPVKITAPTPISPPKAQIKETGQPVRVSRPDIGAARQPEFIGTTPTTAPPSNAFITETGQPVRIIRREKAPSPSSSPAPR